MRAALSGTVSLRPWAEEDRSPPLARAVEARSPLLAPAAPLALLAVAGAVVSVGVTALQRSGGLLAGLSAGRAALLAPPVLAVVGIAIIAERARPAERRPAFLERA